MSAGKKAVVFVLFLVFVGFLFYMGGNKLGITGQKKTTDMSGTMLMDLPQAEGFPIFIMFYSNTCAICEKLMPDILNFHKELGNKAYFLLINTDLPETERIVKDFRVEGLPTFFWITTDRKIFDSKVGGWPAKEIHKTILDLIEFSNGKRN